MASIGLGIFYVLAFVGIPWFACRVAWGLMRPTMRDGVVIR